MMNDKDVRRAVEHAMTALNKLAPDTEPREMSEHAKCLEVCHLSWYVQMAHYKYVCERILELLADGTQKSREDALQHFGWIQGALYGASMMTISAAHHQSRSQPQMRFRMVAS